MRAASTSRQTQAAQLRANRQTKCRQKGTCGKTAIRHISAASNLHSANTLLPASFLIQRTKPPDCSRFTPGASGAGHYLTSAISPAAILPAITAITSESPSCQQLLHRHRISLPAVLPPAALFPKALPTSHQPQLPFSAFRNPKMHPHQ